MDMDRQPWEERLHRFQAKLKSDPGNGGLWLDYGDFLESECENPCKALDAYNKAAQLLPNRDLRLRIGSARIDAGEVEAGISIIIEHVTDKPTAHGYCFLADGYLKTDQEDKAEEACRKAIELDPQFDEAHYLRGEALSKSSRTDAIASYRKAIDLNPDYHLAWQALGRELCRDEESIDDGITALRTAVDLDAGDGWAKIYLANAYWRQCEYEEANFWYKEAIESFPEYEQFKRWYREFLGEWKEETNTGTCIGE